MKKILLIAGFALLSACGRKPNVNSLPLNREEFKANLKAIHLFEASLDKSIYAKDTLSKAMLADYDSVFVNNKTTKADFIATYDVYYEHYVDDLDSLYKEIENEFQQIKDSLETTKKVRRKLNLGEEKNIGLIDEQVVEEKLELNPEFKPKDKKLLRKKLNRPQVKEQKNSVNLVKQRKAVEIDDARE